MKRIGLLVGSFIAGIAGCGGDSDSGNETALEGVYEITEWTENPDGCSSEGPSVLPDPFGTTHFYVSNASFLGQSFVNVGGCGGVAACQEAAATVVFDLSFFGPLVFGNDADGWTNDDSSCGGGSTVEYADLSLRQDGDGALVLEARVKTLSDPPEDDEGFLDCEAGYARVADAPCEQLEVIRGTLVDSL